MSDAEIMVILILFHSRRLQIYQALLQGRVHLKKSFITEINALQLSLRGGKSEEKHLLKWTQGICVQVPEASYFQACVL